MNPSEPGLKLFYVYAREDENFRDELETHLSLLKREGVNTSWHDRLISPGEDWRSEIDREIENAEIIALLLSPDFLASDFCYEVEAQRALERHKSGDVVVLPIVVRPIEFEETPFAHLQSLPEDAKPVSRWDDRDEAWLDVARGLRVVCRNRKKLVPPAIKDDKRAPDPEENPEDFGILDFQAELFVAIQVAVDSQKAIAKHSRDATEAINAGAAKMAQAKTLGSLGPVNQRQAAREIAGALAVYAKRMENTSSELSEGWDRVDAVFPRLLELRRENMDPDQVKDLRESIVGAGDGTKGARESAMKAKEGFKEMGRLSAALKFGTSRATRAIDSVVEQYWRVENSLNQMVSLLDGWFDQAGPSNANEEANAA